MDSSPFGATLGMWDKLKLRLWVLLVQFSIGVNGSFGSKYAFILGWMIYEICVCLIGLLLFIVARPFWKMDWDAYRFNLSI
jgi:hypothetical protein